MHNSKAIKFILAALLSLAAFLPSFAQVKNEIPTVSLLTASPGPVIYELDGHTGLRFNLPGQYDFVVNWGVFDFGAPNFLYRFVKGETDYMACPFETSLFLSDYQRHGRTVVEQRLNLTPEQTLRLEELVYENLRPENRTYRYNYIYDNCATRPLALIEKALGSPIKFSPLPGFTFGETGIPDAEPQPTFRRDMARSHADYPWYQFGIDLALGSGLDKKISPRERTYQPLYLSHLLLNATYTDSLGREQRVAADPVVLFRGGKATEGPTPWYLTPMAAALLVLALTLWITVRDIRRNKITRWLDSVLYSIFFIASLLLTFLIFVSVHEASSPNWLFLWLNPLCIIPATFIWIKRWKRAVYCYQICNFVALFLLILIGIFSVQSLNSALYPLIGADILLAIRYIIIYRRD